VIQAKVRSVTHFCIDAPCNVQELAAMIK
jgi:hypothetical protein